MRAGAVEEVLRHGQTRFREPLLPPPVLPLPDEPHVADWRRYAAGAGEDVFARLASALPQLAIPVREGISTTSAYRDVMRRGAAFSSAAFGGRLELEAPRALRVTIESHPAGALPVLATGSRRDFETLYAALACRHEPRNVPASVNAQMVSGLVNWDRVARYREAWSSGRAGGDEPAAWAEEAVRVEREEPSRFLDRVLLVCDRPYSGVSAAALGLAMGDEEWLERSRALRVEHELTHYATKRVFGVMSQSLHDELLADFMGISLALGRFEAAWFLRFLGLEDLPRVRPGGRLHAYTAGLSGDAVALLCDVVAKAAAGIESLAARPASEGDRLRFFVALTSLGLDLLAGDERERRFAEAWEEAGRLLRAAV